MEHKNPKVVVLYPCGERDPEVIRILVDDGPDFVALLKEWQEMDDKLCGLVDPEANGWLPVDTWLESKGVKILAVTKRISLPL